MEFKDKLRQLRKDKGLSQQALADAIFVSRSAVAKWENGLGLPSESSLTALLEYFQVPRSYFDTEDPEAVIVKKNQQIRRLNTLLIGIVAVMILYVLAVSGPERLWAFGELTPLSWGMIGLTVLFGLQLLLCFKAKHTVVKLIPLFPIGAGLVLCGAMYLGLFGSYSAGAISGNQLVALILALIMGVAAVGILLAWGVYAISKRPPIPPSHNHHRRPNWAACFFCKL